MTLPRWACGLTALIALGAAATMTAAQTPGNPLTLRPAEQTCIQPGGKAGPISVPAKGPVRFATEPLFTRVYVRSGLTPEYVLVARPPGSPYRLVIGAEEYTGPVEAAIVDTGSIAVVSPGIFGPGRVRSVGNPNNVLMFPAACDGEGKPYEEHPWQSFGNGRYLLGVAIRTEGEGALIVIDLQTGLWALWYPPFSAYPPPRGRLPAGQTARDWMLYGAETSRTKVTAINAETGQISLNATFSFDCNMWQGMPSDGSDPCLNAGIPDINNDRNKSPELLKTYAISLQLAR
jgi:hypothetical protein